MGGVAVVFTAPCRHVPGQGGEEEDMVTPAGLKDQPAEVHAPVGFLGRGQDRITINVVLSSGWHLPAGLKRTYCP